MIISAFATGPHASTLTLEDTAFYRQELLERAQCGFSIILPVNVAMLVFGDRIRISCLASVDQANRKPCLICFSLASPNDVTHAINASTNIYSSPRRYAI